MFGSVLHFKSASFFKFQDRETNFHAMGKDQIVSLRLFIFLNSDMTFTK